MADANGHRSEDMSPGVPCASEVSAKRAAQPGDGLTCAVQATVPECRNEGDQEAGSN